MRNLKKILALVLALVMSMSLMATANAAFTDEDDITGAYDEAVQVMSALEVFRGMPDGSFAPQDNINRAQVAAMVYRIATADVDDSDAAIHAGYGNFDDVNPNQWHAGYIGYCANAKLITGYGNGKFGPNDNVTGYQALAMILRAIGYGREGEFQGTGWEIRTAALAEKLGILKNIGTSARRLSEAASREMVAEILFQAILVPQASWTPALGYVTLPNTAAEDSLAYESFGLLTETVPTTDEWGRPGYDWKIDRNANKRAESSDITLVSMVNLPIAEYWTATTECDVAQDYPFSNSRTFTTYTNGIENDDTDTLFANNTVSTIGAQGRRTMVYTDRIVYIDTLLANVTYVREATFDAAGHVRTPSTITLKVYDRGTTNATVGTFVTLTNGATNYEWAVGDMLLVNAVQNVTTTTSYVTTSAALQHVEIIDAAESMIGAQSTIWANANRHVIGDATYNDNNRFHLNQAGNDITNHTWYFDTQGNLIGATDIVSNNYAVLKSIVWVVGNPGHAEATLIDMAGNESTVTVKTMDGLNDNMATGWRTLRDDARPFYVTVNAGVDTDMVGTTPAYIQMSNDSIHNGRYQGYALYRVDTNLDGTVSLEGFEGTAARATNIVKHQASTRFNNDHSAILKNGGDVEIYVSNNTQYLVKGANNTYSAITGAQAAASYSSMDIFYTDVNGDQIAEYVYIKTGTPVGANAAWVYVTDTDYTYDVTEGQPTSTMIANVNGEPGVKLVTGRSATEIGYLQTLARNPGKLFLVNKNSANGYVTGVALVDTTDSQNIGSVNGVYAAAVTGYESGVIVTTAGGYRVNANTVVMGAYDTIEAAIANNCGIWVLYVTNPDNTRTATRIYVGTPIVTESNIALLARADAHLNALPNLNANGGLDLDPVTLTLDGYQTVEEYIEAQILDILSNAGFPTGKLSLSITTAGSAPVQFNYTLVADAGLTTQQTGTAHNWNTVTVTNNVTQANVEAEIRRILGAATGFTTSMSPVELSNYVESLLETGISGFTFTSVTVTSSVAPYYTLSVDGSVAGITVSGLAVTVNMH